MKLRHINADLEYTRSRLIFPRLFVGKQSTPDVPENTVGHYDFPNQLSLYILYSNSEYDMERIVNPSEVFIAQVME